MGTGIGNLDVILVEGQLRDVEFWGEQDPYVTLEMANQKFRSKVCQDAGETPVFNERFTFLNVGPGMGAAQMVVRVWDKNMFNDKEIGAAQISMAKLYSAGCEELRVPLSTHKGKPAGELRMMFIFKPHSGQGTWSAPSGLSHSETMARSTPQLQEHQAQPQAPLARQPVPQPQPQPQPAYGHSPSFHAAPAYGHSPSFHSAPAFGASPTFGPAPSYGSGGYPPSPPPEPMAYPPPAAPAPYQAAAPYGSAFQPAAAAAPTPYGGGYPPAPAGLYGAPQPQPYPGLAQPQGYGPPPSC